MNQIFAQLFYEMEKHRDTVLVTLIDAAGSAPRKSGSQMLVGANGRLTGTIGGGAVERRSEEMAMALLREKRSAVHDFLLHTAASDGDIGMVCGGDVTAHFQFIPAEDTSIVLRLVQTVSRIRARISSILSRSRYLSCIR